MRRIGERKSSNAAQKTEELHSKVSLFSENNKIKYHQNQNSYIHI